MQSATYTPDFQAARRKLLAGHVAEAIAPPLGSEAEELARIRLLLRVRCISAAKELLGRVALDPIAATHEALLAALLENQPLDQVQATRAELGAAATNWRLLQADAMIAMRRGDPAAEAIGQDALRNCPQEDQAAAAEILGLLCRIAAWCGLSDRAVSYASAALARWTVLKDPPGQADILLELSRLQREQERFELALELLDDSERVFIALWDRAGKWERRRIRAECLVQLGHLDEAERILKELIGEALGGGDRYLLGMLHMLLAQVHSQRGRIDEADLVLRAANRWVPPSGQSYSRCIHAILSAALALAKGNAESDLAEAEQNLLASLDDLGTRGVPAEEIRRRIFGARSLVTSRRTAAAQDCLAEALRVAQLASLSGATSKVLETIIELNLGVEAVEESNRPLANSWKSAAAFGGYVRRGVLGSGGFGTVYRAFDLQRGREVALKVLPIAREYSHQRRQILLQSVLREVRASRYVSHPGVARIFAIGESPEGDLYVTSQLIEGEPLSGLIGRPKHFPDVQQLLHSLAESMATLHRVGLVHCDIKPANVLVTASGNAVLIDLGISALKRELQKAGGGTPGYQSPEQARGKSVDQRSDVFSFAVLAVELLMGHRPIGDEDERLDRRRSAELMRSLEALDVPRPVAECLLRSLFYQPHRRPEDGKVIAQLLRQATSPITHRAEVALPTAGAGSSAELPPTERYVTQKDH